MFKMKPVPSKLESNVEPFPQGYQRSLNTFNMESLYMIEEKGSA